MIAAQYGTETASWWADFVTKFNAANEGINLVVDVVSWNDIYTVVNTRIAARVWLRASHEFYAQDGDPIKCTGWQFIGYNIAAVVVALLLCTSYSARNDLTICLFFAFNLNSFI